METQVQVQSSLNNEDTGIVCEPEPEQNGALGSQDSQAPADAEFNARKSRMDAFAKSFA